MIRHRGPVDRSPGLTLWACALLQLTVVSTLAAASLQRRGQYQDQHRRDAHSQAFSSEGHHAASGSLPGLPSLEGRVLNHSQQGKGQAQEIRRRQQPIGLTPKQRWKDNFLRTFSESREEEASTLDDSSPEQTPLRLSTSWRHRPLLTSPADFAAQAAVLSHSSAFTAPPHVGLQRLQEHLGTKGWSRLRRKMKEIKVPKSKCNVRVGKQFRFRTVQSALNAVGDNKATHPVVICISPGTYFERLHVGKKQNGITLQGYGMKTIITWNNSASITGGPFKSATLIVEGNNFTARTLMVLNSVLSTTDPSPAVTVYPTRTTWDRVGIVSWTIRWRFGAGPATCSRTASSVG